VGGSPPVGSRREAPASGGNWSIFIVHNLKFKAR